MLRKREAAAQATGDLDEAEQAKLQLAKDVREQMGPLLYYLTPWNRVRMEVKIQKRREIEATLAANLENGDDDDQDDDDVQLTVK